MIFFNRQDYESESAFFWKENCPFCEHWGKEKKYIVATTKHWSIRYNKFPYLDDNQEFHLLAIPKKHRIMTTELTYEELKDYKNVEHFMQKYYKAKEYFSFIRQWYAGRSVEHLHYHYLPWVLFSSKLKKILN